MTPEGKVLASIIKYLDDKKYYYLRMNATNGTFGTPDLIMIGNAGRFVAIEVKAKDYKPTKLQTLTKEHIEKKGGLHIVAYSLDDVIEGLTEGLNENTAASVSKADPI